MSATRIPPPQPAQRVGATPKQSAAQGPGDEQDFRSQVNAWLESHRASLVDSLRRLGKQPVGSFFTCLVMAVALSLPMGLSLLLDNVERLGGTWQRAAQISLFLQIDASEAEGQALRDRIAAMDDVAAPGSDILSTVAERNASIGVIPSLTIPAAVRPGRGAQGIAG